MKQYKQVLRIVIILFHAIVSNHVIRSIGQRFNNTLLNITYKLKRYNYVEELENVIIRELQET